MSSAKAAGTPSRRTGSLNGTPTSATKQATALARTASTRKRQSLQVGAAAVAGSSTNGRAASTRQNKGLATESSSTAVARDSTSDINMNLDTALNGSPELERPPMSSRASDMDSVLDGYAQDIRLSSPVTEEELSRLTREQLLALIARERSEKEELEGRLVVLSTEHATLTDDHAGLSRAHALADNKLQTAYDTASRLEEQLASQHEQMESLTSRMAVKEKELRESNRRKKDELAAIEEERASLVDNEVALRNRISDLERQLEDRALKSTIPPLLEAVASPSSDVQTTDRPVHVPQPSPGSTSGIVHTDLALQSRLDNLTREHERVIAQSVELHAQLEDLQRLTSELQEENENYEALLSERMLHDIGAVSAASTAASGELQAQQARPPSQASSSTDSKYKRHSMGSSRPSSSLSKLEEDAEEGDEDHTGDTIAEVLEGHGDGNALNGAVGARNSIIRTPKSSDTARMYDNTHRRTTSSSSIGRGSTLNLEAELGRAERSEEEKAREEQERQRKQAIAARRKANASNHLGGREGDPLPSDIDSLQKEVKLLRQENKGLTTYVGKILERVIGLEGFERVLAVDKDLKAAPPLSIAGGSPPESSPPTLPSKSSIWQRPSFLQAASSASVQSSGLSPISPTTTLPFQNINKQLPIPQLSQADAKKKNRMSMDWITPSFWRASTAAGSQASQPIGAGSSSTLPVPGLVPTPQPPAPGLKPMMLGARPASNEVEDEEDQITRARLQSEMRLLGLDNAGSPVLHASASMTAGAAGSRLSVGRSPSQRLSGIFAAITPTGASPSQTLPVPVSKSTILGAPDENSGLDPDPPLPSQITSGSESIKLRQGHRKRPSAGNRDSATGVTSQSTSYSTSPRGSIGLGLTYSSGGSSSTNGARSPSATSASASGDSPSLHHDARDKRYSAESTGQ